MEYRTAQEPLMTKNTQGNPYGPNDPGSILRYTLRSKKGVGHETKV